MTVGEGNDHELAAPGNAKGGVFLRPPKGPALARFDLVEPEAEVVGGRERLRREGPPTGGEQRRRQQGRRKASSKGDGGAEWGGGGEEDPAQPVYVLEVEGVLNEPDDGETHETQKRSQGAVARFVGFRGAPESGH
jgi:hypothetical protein